MDPTTTAIIAICIAALSEIIGMSKLKDNSVIELVLRVLKLVFPKARK